MSDDTRRFLTALLDGVPDTSHFLLWTLPDKISQWFPANGIDAAVTAVGLAAGKDVYVGVALVDRDRGPRQRIKADAVSGLVGLWADIDIAHEDAHKGKTYPPDEAKARAIIDATGCEPTLLVHSGHGLQAWWLFDEPLMFTSADERAAAATLAHRWNLTLKVRAAELGFALDSTFDLSRVMRVPGSTNHKGEPVDVVLLKHGRKLTGPRWAPSSFDDYMADERAPSLLAGRRTYVAGELELRADAQPDIDRLDAMRDNDTKFRQSWDRTRKDLDDDSASSYDLSIATIAAGAGWTDQDIANLIIASRRKHGDDLKLRADYYARTISRARDSQARATSTEEIEHATERVEQAAVSGDPSVIHHARRQLLDHLSHLAGVEFTRWVRYTQDPPRYRFETPAGAITIGGADIILNQTRMRAAIAAATGIVIPRFKTPKWDEIAQAIFKACEDEDTGIESTDEGTAFAWMIEYLQDRPVVDVDDTSATGIGDAILTQTPYRNGDGVVHVFGASLRKWLWLSRGERVTAAKMGEVLRALKAEPDTVSVTIGGKHTSRSVWRVPDFDA